MKKTNSLYLISSNSSKEYILDILEAVSLPFDSTHHFRYSLEWLDNDVKNSIKLMGETDLLKNTEVIICYLYIDIDKDNKNKWNYIYPLRKGVLIDSYKTGDSNIDIAHFYFKVKNFINYDNKSDKIIEELIKNKNKISSKDNIYIKGEGIRGKTLVFWNKSLPDKYVIDIENSKSAFLKNCRKFDIEKFKSPEGHEYFPIFLYVNCIRDSKGETILPNYDSNAKKSYFELDEGKRYSFEFSTYFSEKPPEFLVKLSSDEKVFSSPREHKLRISSRYDDETWILISTILEKDVDTYILLNTELNHEVNNKEPLNLNINFYIKIVRRIGYRILSTIVDIFLFIITLAIALSKTVWSWWYLFIILVLIIWLILKFTLIKKWKG